MTPVEAQDIMFAKVLELTQSPVIIVWPDKPDTVPVGEKWIRPAIKTALSKQTNLATSNGVRRFTRYGILLIDCYAPVGDGNVEVNNLAHLYVQGLERLRSSPIWYRNIRFIEMGKEGSSSRVSVMADFQYDEFN
jgi:hypothetical protein